MKNYIDLEERTFQFSKKIVFLIRKLPQDIPNTNSAKQLVRSGTSIGANYIEANDPLGKKDSLMHLKISRKEAKESVYWLKLILETNYSPDPDCKSLLNEAIELKLILSKMIDNFRN